MIENNKSNSNFKTNLYNEKSKVNKYILPIFVIFLFILLNTVIVFNLYAKDKSKSDILRLHVVANSNSTSDQIIKLKVENEINNYIKDNFTDIKDNKQEIINNLKSKNSELISLSNNILNENGFNYDTTIKIGKIYYDEKKSQTLTMEKGTYDSIQILLGEAKGRNIWSLIFPNETTIKNISSLDSILPGIKNLFNDDNGKFDKENTIEYDSKILEILRKIL